MCNAVKEFSSEVGDLMVILITGETRTFIAEVTEIDPLVLKVLESGPYASLKSGDYIIKETATEQIQADRVNGTCGFLQSEQEAGKKVVSGLKSLGIEDDRLHEILPES